jgi:hypothetical protein
MVSVLLSVTATPKAQTGLAGLTVKVRGTVPIRPLKAGVKPCCARNGRFDSSTIEIAMLETGKLTDTETQVASCALGLGLACGVVIQMAPRI